jgi:hypothetical protein
MWLCNYSVIAWLQGEQAKLRRRQIWGHSSTTFLMLLWFFPFFHDAGGCVGIGWDCCVNAMIGWCIIGVICGWQLCCVAGVMCGYMGRCMCETFLMCLWGVYTNNIQQRFRMTLLARSERCQVFFFLTKQMPTLMVTSKNSYGSLLLTTLQAMIE